MQNLERLRLFGGAGYSNWRDVRAMLKGLPPSTPNNGNITECVSGAALCDGPSQVSVG